MKTYIVSCYTEFDNEQVQKAISTVSPDVLKIQKYLWLIKSELTPQEITKAIINVIGESDIDKVFVCEIKKNLDSSFASEHIQQWFG